MKTRKMTTGTPWVHILRFALPVLASSLLQQLYQTVDTIIVGRYAGEASLAAVGTTGSIFFFFLAVAIGLSGGNGVVVAQFYGAGDEKNVRRAASTGMIFMLILGVIITLFSLVLARPLFTHVVSVPGSFLHLTLLYFGWIAAGIIFICGYNIVSSILRAVGDSAASMYFLLITSVVNVVLDYLFVAVFHWGVTGAAVATVISQIAAFVSAYVYMTVRYPLFRFKIRDFTWDSSLAKHTVRIGFPIALQMMLISIGLTFIQRAVNSFGQTMTASFTVGHRIELYMNMPATAFHTTMATYTGQNIGAGKPSRVKKGVRQTFVLCLGMTLIISAAVWFSADRIIGLFGLTSQAAVYCTEHLHAIALINIILSLYIPLFGVFQGTNHALVPALVAVFAWAVRIAVIFIFKGSNVMGYSIVWWNGAFGFTLGCIITWTYYLSGRWQKNARVAPAPV